MALNLGGGDDYRKRISSLIAQTALDTSPIQSPWQGMSRLAHALLASKQMHDQSEQDKEYGAALGNLPGLSQNASIPTAGVPEASAPSVATAPQPSATGKVYFNDEPSPLDPPSGDDRKKMIATVLGEAANQPAEGQNAVASVIRNRAVNGGYGGDTPSGVVTAKNQFEPWNTEGGRARMARAMANPGQAAAADRAIAMAYGEGGQAPNDPTGGALNFIQPKLQTALGRPMPDWAQKPGVMIGDHKFIGGANAQQQVASADPNFVPGAPAAAPAPQPQQMAQAQPVIPPQVAAQIRQMVGSRDPRMQALGLQKYQEAIKAATPKVTDDITEYERAQRDPAFRQYLIDMKKASKPETSVNIDQKSESEFTKASAKHQAERFDKIVQGSTDAQGMVANIQSLRDIGSRIETGKTTELKAALGPYAESIGIKIDGLDDMQAYKAIVARIAPTMRVPGSGATSDFEMRTFLEALPGIGKTPGGNEIISQTLDSLAQHKIAAGEIASRAMAGEITAREAEKELRALPDPLTLWKKSRGKPAEALGGNQAPAAPTAEPIVIDGYKIKAR